MKRCSLQVAIIFIFLLPIFAVQLYAQDSVKQDNFNLHFQTTYIYQYKPAFKASYSGVNSLSSAEEKQNSITATLFAGARLWKGAAVFVNPEIAGGSGLSGALGMAGSSNGETFRVGSPSPALYWGRYFLQQTFALSKEKELQDDDANQLRGYIPKNYLNIYAGKFSLGDMFDNNVYSNSPRTQFMNWSLMNNGAWDYAANVRGYTLSVAAELKWNDFTYKITAAALPKVANGEKLNTNFKDSFAIALNAEIDKAFIINRRPANLRLLVFRNVSDMGNYKTAIQSSQPDIVSTRALGRTKWGIGINYDQQLNPNIGLFARAGWNDGRNETWAFTEIDRTASAGVSFDGAPWKRIDDNAGAAIVVNGISSDHKTYLTKGGSGFILGDGKLNYASENIAELYYNCKLSSKAPLWITGDYQFVLNPGYNKDRGPVHIFSVRVHTEF